MRAAFRLRRPTARRPRNGPTAERRSVALRLALIGDPVAHSQSPALYRAFLAEAALHGSYTAVRVPAGEGAAELHRLGAEGFRGVNVTTPLKEEAFAYCVAHDAVAGVSRSVNTVVFQEDGAAGYNTDGAGATGALREALATDDLAGVAILVLGAGPTARAAAFALRAADARVALWNRTHARALAAAESLGVALWRGNAEYDAVLSTLLPHAHLDDAALRATLDATPVIVDANYGPRATLAAALARPVVDGAAMLRASARASFALFAA